MNAQIVAALLRKYDLHAKKSWGQNFLVHEPTYRAIVHSCHLGADDVAVEIGAGLGTLTQQLLLTGATVVAVERERSMCAVLRAELGDQPKFQLREENALTLDLPALARDLGKERLVLVGNLPYQISTPLLFHFLSTRSLLSRIVIMLQREVADRVIAKPGDSAYGALSAQVQMLARARRVCAVGRGGFMPPPQVDSAVILLEPVPGTTVPVKDVELYSQVVRAAFFQRRKMIHNALHAAFGERADQALAAAQIDPRRRGETLSPGEFAAIADVLSPVRECDAGAA